jgi:hypothetical protein
MKKEFVRRKRYDDVAYVEGYKSAFLYGALYNLPDADAEPAAFFTLGYDLRIDTFEEYKKLLKDIPNMHKSAYAWAQRTVRDLEHSRDEGLVIHHVCQL